MSESGGRGRAGEGSHGDSGGESKGEQGGEKDKAKVYEDAPMSGFVFGSSRKPRLQGEVKKTKVDTSNMRRRVMDASYRDKLITPGHAGFLICHEEEDDIVNGWKKFFGRKNDEGIVATEEDCSQEEEQYSHSRIPSLKMTSEQYAAWCRPWMNSLIIKVLGADIPMYIIRDRIHRMWKPVDPMKMIPLSNGYCIVSFTTKEDRDFAFQEGPWMIDDHYLIVQRWRPNFNPWKADVQRKIAVWIRLPDLPLEFYNVESLNIIGNMVGRTLRIDRSTSIYDKGGFARICVEIDLHQPLLPTFEIFGEDRPIVYEGLHQVFFHCGKYGHQKVACPRRENELKENNITENRGGNQASGTAKTSSDDMTEVTMRKAMVFTGETLKEDNLYGKIRILYRDFRSGKVQRSLRDLMMKLIVKVVLKGVR